jgi:hypothetical protein
MSGNVKSHSFKTWSNNWTECATHEVVLFESLKEDLINAGIPAQIVFNVDGDAYVIEVESSGGVLEIGPGTMTSINGVATLTSRASGLYVYRTDGQTVDSETANDFEMAVLSVIANCQ